VQVSNDCVTKFNELKLNKKLKFIIYKLSDDYKEIVVEEESENGDWDFFREKLLSAESKSKTVHSPYTSRALRLLTLETGKGWQGPKIRYL